MLKNIERTLCVELTNYFSDKTCAEAACELIPGLGDGFQDLRVPERVEPLFGEMVSIFGLRSMEEFL